MKPNEPNAPPSAAIGPAPYLYRISTVMQLLDISHATVYRLVAKGDLELVKLGTRTSRITSASVERLIAGRRE